MIRYNRRRTWRTAFILGTAALLLAACGGAAEKAETEIAQERQQESLPETTAEPETEAPETEPEDIPPEPGMVRSSLTHQWVTQAEEEKRPLAVMYPTDKKAQPQYGIDRAEIFYEIMAEGDISRQMGILKDWEDLDRIGNIRSIRPYFIETGLEWDPIFVHAGGPEVFVRDLLTREDVDNLNGVAGVLGPDYGAFYRYPKGSISVHSLYTDAEHVETALEKAGFSRTHKDVYKAEHFHFVSGDAVNDLSSYQDAVSASELDLSGCFPVSRSTYSYHPEDGLYYKTIYGKPQCDAVSGNQLAFRNILIEFTTWKERGKGYKAIDVTSDVGYIAYYITGGKMIPLRWYKTGDYEPTRFYDGSGQEVSINTGKTQISVVRIEKDHFTADGETYDYTGHVVKEGDSALQQKTSGETLPEAVQEAAEASEDEM